MKVSTNNTLKKIYHRHTMYLDIVAFIFSFATAFFMRYFVLSHYYAVTRIQVDLYMSLFLFLFLSEIVIYHLKRRKWSCPPYQEKFEVIAIVVKSQIYLLVCVMFYLFLTKWTLQVSRTVLGLFFVLNTVFDSAVRLYYRYRILSHILPLEEKVRNLLVTEKKYAALMIRKIHVTDGNSIAGVYLCDADKELKNITHDEKEIEVFTDRKDIKNKSFMQAIVYLPDYTQERIFNEVSFFEKKGIPSKIILTALGDVVEKKNLSIFAGSESLNYSGMLGKYGVLGVNYTISNISEAVFYVRHHLKKLKGKYICFSNVHTTVMSYEDEALKDVENEAALTFPDGAPIASILRHEADANAVRMAGPDFVEAMLLASMDGKTTHFFYGASENTLKQLQIQIEKKYPGLIVKGYYSPPFRQLTVEEEKEIVEMINKADPDIIWVGLGAPKQEFWMAEHKGLFRGVMVGVGAAFDFHAGTIKRAPKWMQLLSLEWLYRLSQSPKRLFKRYFVTNARFIMLILLGKNRHKN